MGVRGLWKVIEPTARPAALENLRGKILAIDASIWVYHFLKAMRDSAGNPMKAAHIIGFFRRICKLLFFEIKPVFVFDGQAPTIKRLTTSRREKRREGHRHNARAAANKLLTLNLQREAQLRKNQQNNTVNVQGEIPANTTYLGDPAGTKKKRSTGTQSSSLDQYALPELNSIGPVRVNDQRLLTDDELEEYARSFTDEARLGIISSETIDFESAAFDELPIETRYQLLNTARLKSRLRMGYDSKQLHELFPDSMEFSKFQIKRVSQRNFFTQKLMDLTGMEEDLTRRVSSEKNREYVLKRNEGGYSLSLENKDTIHKPLSVFSSGIKQENKDSSSEDELEDVPLETPEEIDLSEEKTAGPLEPESNMTLDELNQSQGQSEARSFLLGPPPPTASTCSAFDRSEPLPKPKKDIEQQHEETKEQRETRDVFQDYFSESDHGDSPSKTTSPKESPPSNPPWFEGESNFASTIALEDRDKSLNFVPYEFKDTLEQDSQSSDGQSIEEETNVKSDSTPELQSELVKRPMTEPNSPPKLKRRARAIQNDPRASFLLTRAESTSASTSRPESSPMRDTGLLPNETMPEPTSGTNLSLEQEIPSDSIKQEDIPWEAESGETPALMDASIEQTQNQDPVSDSEPVKLSKIETVLADEEAEAAQEEEQELADQLIAEAEENQRFGRDLGANVSSATLETEIANLRGQVRKETRDSEGVTDDMIQECQELLQFFGIPYITAPTEAEAQCAVLFDLGLVDGVVTDDGDCFLFGEVRVYRNFFNQAKYVECYDSRTIESELGLSRMKLVELALLLGSDYTDGVPGIGPVSGVEILAEFGDLEKFKEWWQEAQRFPEKADVGSKLRKRLLNQLGSKLFLDENFPDQQVVSAYLSPVVDDDNTPFEWGKTAVDGLRLYMSRTVGWDEDEVNRVLLPVVQENKRRELQRKSAASQATLDSYYTSARKLDLGSKRADAAARKLRSRNQPQD